jgi:signal transduction histidine kinase
MDEIYPAAPSAAALTTALATAPIAQPRNVRSPRVVLLGDDDATLAGAESAVRVAFPGASVHTLPPDVLVRSIGAHCVVLDRRIGARAGTDVLRALRAGGYAGGVVLLAPAHDVEAAAAAPWAARFGAEGPVVWTGAASALPLVEAMRRAMDASLQPDDAAREAARTRQLIAAGELALDLQHAINNPLTALLAEAQLLEMDMDDVDQRAAVRRIVELCRRTIAVARQFDDVAPPV